MSFSRLGAAAALSLLFAGPLAAQGTKVGYVNIFTVLAEYGPAQEASQALQASVAGYQAEFASLETQYQQAVAQFEQQMSTMTPEARQARNQDLQSQLATLQARSQELQELADQREAEVFAPIFEAIRSVLEEIRLEGGYGVILDTRSQAILVADPALELTQQVLTRLQAESGSEGGT